MEIPDLETTLGGSLRGGFSAFGVLRSKKNSQVNNSCDC